MVLSLDVMILKWRSFLWLDRRNESREKSCEYLFESRAYFLNQWYLVVCGIKLPQHSIPSRLTCSGFIVTKPEPHLQPIIFMISLKMAQQQYRHIKYQPVLIFLSSMLLIHPLNKVFVIFSGAVNS